MPTQSNRSKLHEAANFIKTRRSKDALIILVPFLRENPRSEAGWYLLSYAVQGTHKKIECLHRILRINPDNVRAQERLEELGGSFRTPSAKHVIPSPQFVEAEQVIPKKPRHWWAYLIGFILVSALIVGGYYGAQWLLPSTQPGLTQAVAIIPAAPETPTLSPSPFPTTTPSLTPTASPTVSPTLTPTPTPIPPTKTLAFATADGEVAQLMDNIQNQVSTIRELGIIVDYPRYLISESEVDGFLRGLFKERYAGEVVEDEALVLATLGLIEPGYDLYPKILNNLGGGLGGFYIPWRDELFTIGSNFPAVEKIVYAHVYGHALTDQHNHIDEVWGYPECIYETDRCIAISALVEGDATLMMFQWLEAYASEVETAEVEAVDFSPIDRVIKNSDDPLPYTIREVYFRYFDGQNFVRDLFDAGGWEMVDSVYQRLPISSEQILHPEKYLREEHPIPIDLVYLDELLGNDWRHLKTDTLGELTTQMVLGNSANYLTQIDPIVAANAAAGWGGDRYQVYHRSKSNQTILVAQWRWDSQGDGKEFFNAMSSYLNRRYLGRKLEDIDSECWTEINDHFSCIYRTSRNTLWLLAPDWDTLQLLLSQYPEFK